MSLREEKAELHENGEKNISTMVPCAVYDFLFFS
jgi:hypothetical protein